MKKRILEYRKRIDGLLENEAEETDWKQVMQEHLIQVQFFQHERLVHLLVTLAVAFLTFLSFGGALLLQNIGMLALTFLLICLLIPYIFHYYLLENEVQKMYGQYDKILERIKRN